MTSTGVNSNYYQGFLDGKESALKEIYLEFSPLILGLSRKLVGEDAEDLLQIVFLSAWKNRSQFDSSRGSMKSWLCGITRHRAIDLLRKKTPTCAMSVEDSEQFLISKNISDKQVDQIVDSVVVEEALKELPLQKKRLIEMGFIEQLSHTEIANKTSLPLGTVKSSIRRGLELLQTELAGSNE